MMTFTTHYKWALMDKKTESSNKIINKQNTPIEKSDLHAASEGAIPNNFNLIQSLTHNHIPSWRSVLSNFRRRYETSSQ